ncbi:MAG: asparaginase domain-containing protein [Eubacterium sp.]
MKKILVIALGGTIGSVKTDSIGLDKNNLKILDYCRRDDVEFTGVSPFSVLSENMSIALWMRLIDFLDSIDFSLYKGVIILHGSDTLAYTSSLIANAFVNERIVFVAADKPIENNQSNGIDNFNTAVDMIVSSDFNCPFVSYNGMHRADCITSANIKDEFLSLDSTLPPVNSRIIHCKNVLIINPYIEINFDNYNLDNVDCVLINMYHSATVPDSTKVFCEILSKQCIPYYFVTHKSSADYETADGLDNIIFNCTIENAYARILLTK